MEQAAGARESSWGRCTWQVRLMIASFGAWELESNGVSRNKRERRVVQQYLHGDRITNQYSNMHGLNGCG